MEDLDETPILVRFAKKREGEGERTFPSFLAKGGKREGTPTSGGGSHYKALRRKKRGNRQGRRRRGPTSHGWGKVVVNGSCKAGA